MENSENNNNINNNFFKKAKSFSQRKTKIKLGDKKYNYKFEYEFNKSKFPTIFSIYDNRLYKSYKYVMPDSKSPKEEEEEIEKFNEIMNKVITFKTQKT